LPNHLTFGHHAMTDHSRLDAVTTDETRALRQPPVGRASVPTGGPIPAAWWHVGGQDMDEYGRHRRGRIYRRGFRSRQIVQLGALLALTCSFAVIATYLMVATLRAGLGL
jgi:hypothetical protein